MTGERFERDMAAEMRAHIDMAADELVQQGVPPDEARRRALVAFGGLERHKEAARDVRASWIDSWLRDLRFTVRSLARTPGLTIAAVGILATGIGLTTLAYGVLYSGYLRGLPYPEHDELVIVRRLKNDNYYGSTGPDLQALRTANHSFSGLAASAQLTINVAGTEATARFRGSAVTANTFSLLGVRPVLGRDFQPQDEAVGAPGVIMLGYAVWRDQFGSDSSVVGRAIRVNGRPHTVIGVMPSAFRFPQSDQVWLCLQLDPLVVEMNASQLTYRGQLLLRVWGRLKPGVTIAAGRADADLITHRLRESVRANERDVGAIVMPLEDSYLKANDRTLVYAMLGGVGCVLLVACANVTNLLLNRAVHRTREVAIRSALGASRAAVMRQFLLESGVIALAAVVIGVALAGLGVGALNQSRLVTWLPFYAAVRLYWPVLGVAGLLGLGATIVSGALPAWQARQVDVNGVLKDESRGASNFRIGRASRVLVTGEIALSCVLVVVAGLVIKSARNQLKLEPGFRTAGVFVATLAWPAEDTATAKRQAFFVTLQEGLAALPGVQGAALSSPLPGVYSTGAYVEQAGVRYDDPEDGHRWVYTQAVSPETFTTFGIPLRQGRPFTVADRAGAEPVAIVSEDYVRTFVPNGRALGRRIRLTGGGADYRDDPWRTIVGVVPPQSSGFLRLRDKERVFVPLAQTRAREVSLALASVLPPAELVREVGGAVRALDPDLPLGPARGGDYMMSDVIAAPMWTTRVFAGLFAVLGAAALGLAFVGLYGVMAFSVSRRTREVGIRIALGASARHVARAVLGQGLWQLGIGLALGIAGAAAVSGVVRALLFQVGHRDPAVFAAAVVVLLVAGLLACWTPVRRATRVDPMVALRGE